MPRTIHCGINEIIDIDKTSGSEMLPDGRQRKVGGGRKKLSANHPVLIEELEKLIAPHASGDPMRPLRWTSKSTSKLAEALRQKGFRVSATSIRTLLKSQGYSLQSNRKRFEGKQSPDRECPVISVDAKKKELVGNHANDGQEWTRKGEPQEVEAYDFIDPAMGKVTPYGIYDLERNAGWMNVGTDNDTAKFAVSSIKRWWENVEEWTYPDAKEILIHADGGGSNGSRSRLWKKSLQE